MKHESPSSFDHGPLDDMSVSLLAAQPVTRKPDSKSTPAWDSYYSHFERTMQSMYGWRWTWWAFWEQLARFFMPRRHKWFITPNRYDRGLPVNDQIKDSTGLQAVRTCAGGMWTGLTSPSRPWFKLAIALPWIKADADAQAWLTDTTERLYTMFAGSNFYTIMAQAFKDEIVFGTAPVLTYEDEETGARFYLPCAGEYFLDVGANLENNRFYREFTYNTVQIVDGFKIENCPESVVNAWREGGSASQQETKIGHAIEPNYEISDPKTQDGGLRMVPSSFPWREVYWLRGQKTMKPLSVRGFKEKPQAVFMWSQVSNDPYGHGPCEDCLGDNKQVQLETMRKAEFIGKGVRPPMGADPALKNEPASIIEGNVTYIDTSGNKKGFWPLFEPNPQWLPAITADIAQVNARIEKCLYVDLFMAISKMEGVQPRNELELSKRDLERLQELGPVITLNEKALSDIIQRTFAIGVRRRMFSPPPASLSGVPLKINFTSILRLAQRASQSVSMKDVFQTGGVLSSAAKAGGLPDPLRTLNLDKAYRHYADINEFPPDLFFSDGEVQQHDAIRTQAMHAAAAPQAAMAGVDAAKTLADTSLAPGSALSAITGQGQGQ
jgi:hypothetical protein